MDPYNQFTYESIPFAETHPRHLSVLGRLFELETADPNRCRVLELGCATGGNLIPMAWYHRQARFTGIDLSANQIRIGQKLINDLGLQNIVLHQGDILHLGDELGSFDFVIAHGVYSWVPSRVREQLLQLARRLLNPNGLFYISLNTLPGWRMRGMLRDILLYACRGIDEVQARLDAAYAALTRLENSLGDLQALSARYLREEISYLRKAHPSYLLFEYLAEENNAFLFSEFLADIQRHRLRYLCDTELANLFPSTFGNATEKALADIEDDMDLEQWLDFVSARNFRRCVLCRDDTAPAAELSLDAFAECAFGTDLNPPRKLDLRRVKATPFHQSDGNPINIEHPLTKAMLVEMARQQPDLLRLDHLLPAAQGYLAQHGGERFAEDYQACLMELFSLFSHRVLHASPGPQHFYRDQDPLPLATPLARAQMAAGQRHVATARHTNMDLDTFAARFLHYLDGEHSLQQISDLLVADLENGRLTPPSGLKMTGWSTARVGKIVEHNTRELIELFSRQGILMGRYTGRPQPAGLSVPNSPSI